MKPLACTNTQPGIPPTLESSSSLRPHHSDRRESLQVCAYMILCERETVRQEQGQGGREREGERERGRGGGGEIMHA